MRATLSELKQVVAYMEDEEKRFKAWMNGGYGSHPESVQTEATFTSHRGEGRPVELGKVLMDDDTVYFETYG